ncbi:hypothetical protein PIB30_013877 [Stylosanthes scabra]|uniref:Uncharacterized protein n=1 Tax=Stylosanthes scabra TaxID=79078 RepID=A0ABU6U893_9FABA|nr:hypothetical protein [Stylosanthes scabra]
MLTRIGGSRIPWVTRSSSLTNSTVSSATSRPKRHCDLPNEDDHFDGPCPRSSWSCSSDRPSPSCSRVTSTYPWVPISLLRSGGTKEDAAKALPPLDVSILPSDEQTTPASTPTVHIPDVPGSIVPRMSFVSPPEGPAEVCGDCSRQD